MSRSLSHAGLTMAALVLAVCAQEAIAAPRQARAKPPAPAPAAAKPPEFFTASMPVSQMTGKQAVLETSAGTMVMDLLPDRAPNHVAYFMKLAGEGAYNGIAFHRVIRYGIIQGGDPLSKDPSKQSQYGTGGLGVLQAEPGDGSHTRGAVSAVLVPGKRDSAGAQFFICVTDQVALNGQYTLFARAVEGIEVAQKISEAAADAGGRPQERIEIRTVTIRNRPAPEAEPFVSDSAEQMADYRAVLETSAGPITIRFFPDKAPEHVRNFLQLAAAGVFDGTAFHRVVPGFVIQTGSLSSRATPLTQAQQRHVHTLQPEFNDRKHVKGIVSMARGDDPASANTSFFICTGTSTPLDGQYTVFGEVVDGLSVVEAIEKTPVNGETPVQRIELTKVTIAGR